MVGSENMIVGVANIFIEQHANTVKIKTPLMTNFMAIVILRTYGKIVLQ
jgi:hypothetical protein